MGLLGGRELCGIGIRLGGRIKGLRVLGVRSKLVELLRYKVKVD